MNDLVDERDNLLIIYSGDGQGIKTITKDAYNELKYKQYGGNRIFYDFDENNKIAETYDSRIFNCTMNGKTINIRDGNKVAKAILAHKETGKMDVFQKTFKAEFYEANKKEIVDSMMTQFEGRVVPIEGGYVVDDLFMVDMQGTSHYKSSTGWNFLCTVAQGNLRNLKVSSEVGDLDIDPVSITIIAKIYFLLNPNLKDHVFFDQLPENIKKFLKEQEKGR